MFSCVAVTMPVCTSDCHVCCNRAAPAVGIARHRLPTIPAVSRIEGTTVTPTQPLLATASASGGAGAGAGSGGIRVRRGEVSDDLDDGGDGVDVGDLDGVDHPRPRKQRRRCVVVQDCPCCSGWCCGF